MERRRDSRVLLFILLAVIVVAMGVGFAAFTQNLNISEGASVNPADTTLNVLFSSSNSEQKVDDVAPVASSGASADAAVINNSGAYPTISNLNATFTDKGQNVTYTFYVHNDSAYIAYLRSVVFNNASSASTFKVCTPGLETTGSTVNSAAGAACDDINLSISIDGDVYSSSNSEIGNTPLAVDAYHAVVVTISYDGSHDLPDGDFSVSFGDITLGYSSIDK